MALTLEEDFMTENTSTKQIALAELLLRRKELNALFNLRYEAQAAEVTKDRVSRRKVNEETDQVEGQISLVDKALLEREHNYYAHQRRLADSVVQQANWTTTVHVEPHLMSDDENAPTEGSVPAKLAELLVRRKDLEQQLGTLNMRRLHADEELYHQVSERLEISKGLGELVAKVTRKAPSELRPFQRFDLLQAKLREIDASIQHANWDTMVDVPLSVLTRFSA